MFRLPARLIKHFWIDNFVSDKKREGKTTISITIILIWLYGYLSTHFGWKIQRRKTAENIYLITQFNLCQWKTILPIWMQQAKKKKMRKATSTTTTKRSKRQTQIVVIADLSDSESERVIGRFLLRNKQSHGK